MTETTTASIEEQPYEPTIEDLIAEATDRYIADITALGKKWAKDHGMKWGQLPSPWRPALKTQTGQVLNQAIHPSHIPDRGPGIETLLIKPSLSGLPNPNAHPRR
jgi:hypothetical protein